MVCILCMYTATLISNERLWYVDLARQDNKLNRFKLFSLEKKGRRKNGRGKGSPDQSPSWTLFVHNNCSISWTLCGPNNICCWKVMEYQVRFYFNLISFSIFFLLLGGENPPVYYNFCLLSNWKKVSLKLQSFGFDSHLKLGPETCESFRSSYDGRKWISKLEKWFLILIIN